MMENKKGRSAVFGLFNSQNQVEMAVDRLKMEGFRNSDISVLMPSKEGTQNFAHEKATKAPEGASTGAGSGALLGGGLGWLVGIGALAIPGIGPFVAAGPIMAALAGAGVGGAVGGVTGALIGMGIPEYEAKRYETFVKDGGILVSIHVDDSQWEEKAKNLLKVAGARDIGEKDEVGGKDATSGLRTESKADASYGKEFNSNSY